MKKTCLYENHIALGAKMAPFGGYDMPIQYSGIIKEHTAAREGVVIFDTCHMGEFKIRGRNAVADLEKILSCSVASMKIGQCRYGFLCNEMGGVNDDQILYRMAENEFFMVVNASTEESDFEWIKSHLSPATAIENISAQTAKLDLQGPSSAKILQKLLTDPIDTMKYYTWALNHYRGHEILISRTGYTGELGFEIYCTIEEGKQFWNDCLRLGVIAAGLGARDTLRLEMGYPLYGHELDAEANAAESNFPRAISRDKHFIGSLAVLDASKRTRSLIGINLDGRRAVRHGDTITTPAGTEIGSITSGSFSPTMGFCIALGYVKRDHDAPGTPLIIKTGRNQLAGSVTDLPFYKKATGREDIKNWL